MDRPADYAEILEAYAEHLALERGRSEHTRRAYLTDLRGLFAFLDERAPGAGLDALSLPVLRSWLAAQAAAGAARTTLARRTSAVKTFTAWAVRRGLLGADPATRLQLPKGRQCCAPTRPGRPWTQPTSAPSRVTRLRYATG